MHIDPIYSLTFVALTLLITYYFVKRMGKTGCATYAYIGLVILCINLFTIFSWTFMYSNGKDLLSVATSGQKYEAKVVSYTEEERYDSDEDRYYTMYRPTVQFTTQTGKVIDRTLDFSTSSVAIGDTYKVNYNETNNTVITLGFTMVMRLVGVFIFCFIFSFLSAGIIKYTLGHQMDTYFAIVSKIGFFFFIPFLMIGFNALLIYGIFYGNEVPLFVTGLLIFFSVMLALGTLGYIKMILSKGEPTMKRVGPNKWAGDWESEEAEEEYYEERWKNEQKK